MKISTRTRYGVRAALELALHYNQGPLQLRIIAQRQGISVKYLEQLVAVLRSGGILRSVRGARGGYLLTRAPDQINMIDIFSCLEGSIATTECVADQNSCNRAGECVARQLWVDVEDAVNNILANVTLQDLIEKSSGNTQNYQI